MILMMCSWYGSNYGKIYSECYLYLKKVFLLECECMCKVGDFVEFQINFFDL